MQSNLSQEYNLGPEIKLSNVGLKFGTNFILDKINWHVKAGEIHALIGANGCGKSSLLKILLGQMPHTGNVAIYWNNEKKGFISYVPQNIACDKTLPMTVLDFLASMIQKRALFLGIKKEIKQRINNVLKQVNMQDKINRRMGELSGGERQRILLAQSLLLPDYKNLSENSNENLAKLILLDEPFSALDKVGIDIFINILKKWKNAGATIIWVEHDLSAVSKYADYVTALCAYSCNCHEKDSQILWSAKPDTLKDADLILKLFACN